MDGENRGEYDRSVVRALRSLESLTGPTAAERQRIRDRILLSLDAEPGEADGAARRPTGVAGATESPAKSRTARNPPAAESDPATDAPSLGTVPRQRGRARSAPETEPVASQPVAKPRDRTDERTRTDEPTRADEPTRTGEPTRTSERTQTGKHTQTGERTRARERTRTSERTRTGDRTRPRGRAPSDEQTRPPAREREARHGVMAGARGRLAVAALALLALVGSLVGMSVLLARDALPGDALYGVKRTAEAASLGLTFGDEPKALKHLEFAAARVSEIETLARRYPNPEDAPVGGYLTALTDFDNDATAGSRQLITLATRTDGRLLESLRDWSAQQASRLERVSSQLPEAARNRQAASRGLLDRITARADALLARMDCFQTTSGSSDDIGALPATGQCEENNPAPTSSAPQPSVPGTPDNSGSPADGPAAPSTPLPNAEPTPGVPPVPVPGATVSVPLPTGRPTTPTTTPTDEPPLIELPPLLPGLPSLGVG